MTHQTFRRGIMTFLGGGITTTLIIGCSIALGIDLFVLMSEGIAYLPQAVQIRLPKGLEALVAVAITPEAYALGFRSSGEYWQQLWRRLLFLLTIALVVRGVGAGIAAALWGIENPILVGSAFTATDPAAVAISLALVKAARENAVIKSLAWLLAVESIVNDVVGLFIFRFASGVHFIEILTTLFVTLGMALLLACADYGIRYFMRERSPWKGRIQEAKNETLAVFLVYVGVVTLGVSVNASLIGVAGFGSLIADYLARYLPEEQKHNEVLNAREHYQELWSTLGLTLVASVVIVCMPVRIIFMSGPTLLLAGAMTVLFIGLSRALGEAIWSHIKKENTRLERRLALISVTTTMALLGVPSVAAAEAFVRVHTLLAQYMFATILVSWITVPIAIWLIGQISTRLERGDVQ